ncbi:MAG: MotA/TolQ/ExbB proton channel family protein [Alphaproteobacteria bacterium]
MGPMPAQSTAEIGLSAPQPAPSEGADSGGDQHLAWLLAAAKGRTADSYQSLLLLRFAIVNMAALALLSVAYAHGFVDLVISSDQTRLSLVIFGTFLVGLAVATWKAVQTSRELNQIKDFHPLLPSRAATYLAQIRGRGGNSRAMSAAALRLKLSTRIGTIRHFANSLVFLGLIGTVVGFIIALSGVDPANAADVDSITPMVATLIDGMSVALYTTLVGAILNLWLMINYHILASGTVNLITSLVEFGEANARS